SDDTSVATINNDGVATGVKAGTATITYTDANGCSGTATITVNANPVVANKSVCVGSTVDFGPSGTYQSDDTSVATINNDGVATGVKAGTATITYTDANGCSGTATITVNANPVVANKSVCVGSTVDFGPSGTYQSDDTSVATINNDGVATGVKAGTATITYTDANGCSGTATITVNANPVVANKSVCVGSTVDFGPSGTYQSDDTSVATINNDGVATGVKAGTATITYTDANGCSGTATITVNANPVVANKSVCVGSTVDFGPSGTYQSDDTSVATINNDGVATGVKAGTATITYTDANGCSGTATITVIPLPVAPQIQTQLADCIGGDGSAAFSYDDPEITQFYYRYKDANDAGAVFTSWTLYTGVVSLQPGSYTFEVKYTEDGCISDEFTVNITKPQDTVVTLTPSVTQPDCATFLGTIEITNAAALGDLNYTVYNEEVPLASYDDVKYPSGGFTGLEAGVYLITAVSDNGCEFGSVEVTLLEPQCVECGTAFGKDDDGAATCFEDVPNAETLIPNENRWGWTNYYSFGGGSGQDVNTLELYQGAAHCEGGTFVGTVTLTRDGNTLSAKFEAAGNYYFSTIHLYVGGEPFMYKEKGKNYEFTVAPGQYNENPPSLPSEYVTEYTISDIILTGDYYVIAHVDACTSEFPNINEDNISSAITGFYEPNKRFATMLPAIDDDSSSKISISSTSLTESSDPLFSIAPVPFSNELNIGYLFDYTSDVNIQVFDMNGRLLRTYFDTAVNSESLSTFSVDFKTRSGQVYIVRMTTDREIFTSKIIAE
ncbi:T9SS type A sorting domain-containing protein, partial [Gramella sp. KN1008]|uniref:Ig-like domain-containing protein n=1 Tax=Gramella sp. KN1008 TaxID=2529298 RepID=UPI001A93EAA9